MNRAQNISSTFLAPLTGVQYPSLNLGHYSIYVGDYNYEKGTWGQKLFLLIREKMNLLEDLIVNNFKPDDSYTTSEGTVYVKTLDEQTISTIVIPFMEGKYSEIDRTYVEKNFPKYQYRFSPEHKGMQKTKRRNYMILTKDPELREEWEELLDVTIDPESELWDKPLNNLEKEILNYNETIPESTQESPQLLRDHGTSRGSGYLAAKSRRKRASSSQNSTD